MYKLNPRQLEWTKTAKPEEIEAFMAKGPGEFVRTMNRKTFKSQFAPVVRGIFIGNERYDEAEDAKKAYEANLSNLAGKSLPVLDEVALGIDGANMLFIDRCEDLDVNIDQIYHLGSKLRLDLPCGFCDAIEEMSSSTLQKLFPGAPDEEDGEFHEGVFDHAVNTNGQAGFMLRATIRTGSCRKTADWFYGETFQEAFDKSAEWAKEYREKRTVKASGQ